MDRETTSGPASIAARPIRSRAPFVRLLVRWIALLLVACGAPESPPADLGCTRVVNARAPGGAALSFTIRDGRIAEGDCGSVIDAEQRYVVPAFIDAHVHLAYLPAHEELLDHGVAGAVDLAAPMAFFERELAPLRMVRSGPMITAPGGYPTTSWGAGGYGLTCSGLECVDAVDRLADAGAGVIKVPIAGGPELDDETLRAVVERAHARELRVVVHALDDAAALRAAQAGADVLAHTPVAPMSAAAIEAWSGRAVISTLRAFGGSRSAIDNLRRLREAGATILYGTDLGNTSTAGVDATELELMRMSGMDDAAIVAAGTASNASFFGFADLGALEPGKAASFLLVDSDPYADPAVLASPARVFIDGAERY
jgi:predicted amidohydrolase YtcJ